MKLLFYISQIPIEPVKDSMNTINEYGVLGAMFILLLLFVTIVVRFGKKTTEQLIQTLLSKNNELEKRLEELEVEFRTYIIKSDSEKSQIITKNTEAFNNFSRVLEKIVT